METAKLPETPSQSTSAPACSTTSERAHLLSAHRAKIGILHRRLTALQPCIAEAEGTVQARAESFEDARKELAKLLREQDMLRADERAESQGFTLQMRSTADNRLQQLLGECHLIEARVRNAAGGSPEACELQLQKIAKVRAVRARAEALQLEATEPAELDAEIGRLRAALRAA